MLREPVHVLRGDRFVLRNQSAQRTIGGGVVVHPFARRHRRDDPRLLSDLQELRHATTPAHIIGALMRLEPEFAVSPEFLAQAGNLAVDAIREVLRSDPSLRPLPDAANAAACTTAEKWQALRTAVVEALRQYHDRNPLLPGLEMESLRMQIAPDLSPKIYRTLLDALLSQGVIARGDGSTVRLPSHKVTLKRDEEELGARAEALIAAGGVTPPDLKQIEASLRVPRQQLQPILQQLERQGKVVKITDRLVLRSRAPGTRARCSCASTPKRMARSTPPRSATCSAPAESSASPCSIISIAPASRCASAMCVSYALQHAEAANPHPDPPPLPEMATGEGTYRSGPAGYVSNYAPPARPHRGSLPCSLFLRTGEGQGGGSDGGSDNATAIASSTASIL